VNFLVQQERSDSEMYFEAEGACGVRKVSCHMSSYISSSSLEGRVGFALVLCQGLRDRVERCHLSIREG
jgi:hypothetical protein